MTILSRVICRSVNATTRLYKIGDRSLLGRHIVTKCSRSAFKKLIIVTLMLSCCRFKKITSFVLYSSLVCVSVPTNLPIYLPTYLHIYLPTYLPTYISTYLPTYLPTYLHIYLFTYLSTYLPIYLPIYLPTYLPTYLPSMREMKAPTSVCVYHISPFQLMVHKVVASCKKTRRLI